MARTVVDRELFHRVLKGTPETLSIQFEQDGAAADPGTTTIGIVDDAGTTVVAAGTATSGATTAPRTYALTTTHTASLGRLTVTWTTTNFGTQATYVEVVGNHLFSISEARSFETSAMASTTSYPTADIEEVRARITDEFERICGVSFVRRYDRVVLSGTGTASLLVTGSQMPRQPALYLSSVTAADELDLSDLSWDAYDADDLSDLQVESGGVIRRATRGVFTRGHNNIRVTYEYGLPSVPLAIKRAALTLCRYLLVPSNLSERTLQQSAQFGTIQLATAGKFGSEFGIPSVDATLARYTERVAVIG